MPKPIFIESISFVYVCETNEKIIENFVLFCVSHRKAILKLIRYLSYTYILRSVRKRAKLRRFYSCFLMIKAEPSVRE